MIDVFQPAGPLSWRAQSAGQQLIIREPKR